MRSESDGRIGGAAASGRPAPPAVVVYFQSHPESRERLREIQAGLEEEGVPFRTEERPGRNGERAVELAYSAACAATTAVGIGLDAHGSTCVHHAKLGPSAPFLRYDHLSRTTLRRTGHNAARIVKGMPLKPASPRSERTPASRRTDETEGRECS